MPVDTSGFHPIIQAFLRAYQLGQQKRMKEMDLENEEKDRQSREKIVQQQLAEQDRLRKMIIDAQYKKDQADAARESTFGLIKAYATGQLKPQGTYELPSTVTASKATSPSAKAVMTPVGFDVQPGTFDFTQPEPVGGGFTPFPTQIHKIAGVDEPIVFDSDMLSSLSEIEGIKQAAKFPALQTTLAARAENIKALEEGKNARQREKLLFMDKWATDKLGLMKELAQIRLSAAKEGILDRPIGVMAGIATGLDPTTRLRDLQGTMVDRPISDAAKEKADFMKGVMDLTQMAMKSAEANNYADFKPVIGGFKNWFKSKFSPGTQDQQNLRFAIGRLWAIEGHRLFGSAFTANEQATLKRAMADFDMNPQQAATNLEQIFSTTLSAYKRMTEGGRVRPGASITPTRSAAPRRDISGNVIK